MDKEKETWHGHVSVFRDVEKVKQISFVYFQSM